jgi:hypothetical protein
MYKIIEETHIYLMYIYRSYFAETNRKKEICSQIDDRNELAGMLHRVNKLKKE